MTKEIEEYNKLIKIHEEGKMKNEIRKVTENEDKLKEKERN